MLRTIVTALVVASALCGISGCTSAEEQETEAAIQSALTTLTANRALVEQFGRDIKTRVSPDSPVYSDLMESYEEARDSYNHFLDSVAAAGANEPVNGEIEPAMVDAESSTAGFIQSASRALDPAGEARGLTAHRAIKLPVNISAQLQRLPRSFRKRIVKQFGGQVYWRSWGQL